jgi:hypothetical protein
MACILWSDDYKHILIKKKCENVEVNFRTSKSGIDFLRKNGVQVK